LFRFPKSSQIPKFNLKFERNFFLSLGPSPVFGPAAWALAFGRPTSPSPLLGRLLLPGLAAGHLPLSLGHGPLAGPNHQVPGLASFSPRGPLPLRPASLPARLAHQAHFSHHLPSDSQKPPPAHPSATLASCSPFQ
jgi:hypothetical protein